MKYFLDTEFIESGPHKPIDLISIGIVAEDGREFYRQCCEFDPMEMNEWVKENVLGHLSICRWGLGLHAERVRTTFGKVGNCVEPDCPWQSLLQIKADIIAFVGDDPKPEFWGYFSDYDWVVFCQIMGRMIDLPESWPKHCKDIKQWQVDLGRPDLKQISQGSEHHALADAHWNKLTWEFLNKIAAERFIRS